MSDYHVFDTFQDAVLVIDGEGCMFFGNSAAALLFEVSARRMSSGKPLSQFITFDPDPINDGGGLAQILEATQVKEVRFNSSSGKEGWAQVSVQPQPEFFASAPEERNRWIVCLRDVSLEKTLHDKYKAELDKKEAVIRDLEIARGKLEDYSRNLEKMVEERTAELVAMNRLLKAILDSLGQGILVFDSNGFCLPVYSKVCRTILETEPAGRDIEGVLGFVDGDRDAFVSWREAVFGEMLDFEELIPLAPDHFRHSKGLSIALGYNPMRGEDGRIQGVVVVATDRTREEEALREAARERDLVRKVVQVARHREAFRTFVEDSKRLLVELRTPQNLDREELMRRLHTVKGGAATFALAPVASACHELEEMFLHGSEGSADHQESKLAHVAETAKHILELLEKEIADLSDLLGPLSQQNTTIVEMPFERFLHWSQKLLETSSPEDAWSIGREILSECTEKPVAASIKHVETGLRELAGRLGKKFGALRIQGGDVRVPVDQLNELMSSLIHAFRNSVDHGLETPEERLAKGKSESGEINVQFSRRLLQGADTLTIDIRDDGRGIDPEKIRNKLNKIGLSELAKASDEEVIQAILRDDFSTTDTVTEVSGRGVGLGAIAYEAKKLGGGVRVESKMGVGMRLLIQVPVPLGTYMKLPRAS